MIVSFDSCPVENEGSLPLGVLGASCLYDECLFEQLDYSGVKMFNSTVLVPLQSGKNRCYFGTSVMSLK